MPERLRPKWGVYFSSFRKDLTSIRLSVRLLLLDIIPPLRFRADCRVDFHHHNHGGDHAGSRGLVPSSVRSIGMRSGHGYGPPMPHGFTPQYGDDNQPSASFRVHRKDAAIESLLSATVIDGEGSRTTQYGADRAGPCQCGGADVRRNTCYGGNRPYDDQHHQRRTDTCGWIIHAVVLLRYFPSYAVDQSGADVVSGGCAHRGELQYERLAHRGRDFHPRAATYMCFLPRSF